jgi:hypothetical protein
LSAGDLVDSYDAWLFYERRFLRFERYGPKGGDLSDDGRFVILDTATGQAFDWVYLSNAGGRFHGREEPAPSTRAAVVLSAAGCDWRDGF